TDFAAALALRWHHAAPLELDQLVIEGPMAAAAAAEIADRGEPAFDRVDDGDKAAAVLARITGLTHFGPLAIAARKRLAMIRPVRGASRLVSHDRAGAFFASRST